MDCYGQDNLHEASVMQRLALYATLGVLMNALGFQFDTWQFWCFLGLFICSEHLSRQEGFGQGLVQGADIYRSLTAEQRAKVDRILKGED